MRHRASKAPPAKTPLHGRRWFVWLPVVLAVGLGIFFWSRNDASAERALRAYGLDDIEVGTDVSDVVLTGLRCGDGDTAHSFTATRDGAPVSGTVCCRPLGGCYARF